MRLDTPAAAAADKAIPKTQQLSLHITQFHGKAPQSTLPGQGQVQPSIHNPLRPTTVKAPAHKAGVGQLWYK